MTTENVPAKTEPFDPDLELFKEASTAEERAFAYAALDQVRQSRLLRKATAQMAATGWGKGLSEGEHHAVAQYAFATGTDPLRHWEVLGGRMYDRAELWLDLLPTHPDYAGYKRQFIHDDTRLGEGERQIRRALRIEHGVPEEAKGAAIVTIYKRGFELPFIGVNWAGNVGNKKDPVGEQDPTKTAETRAYRKAAKGAFGLWFARHPLAGDEGQALEQLRTSAAETLGRLRAERKATPTEERTRSIGAISTTSTARGAGRIDDGYSEEKPFGEGLKPVGVLETFVDHPVVCKECGLLSTVRYPLKQFRDLKDPNEHGPCVTQGCNGRRETDDNRTVLQEDLQLAKE